MNERMKWTAGPGEGITYAELIGAKPIREFTAPDLGVVFQPIVDLRNGRTFANEALVRCRVAGYESPLDLFRSAEQQNAVGRLGHLIRQITFEQAPPTPLFVNVHPEELAARWLVRPDDPLFFHEQDVFLEITESATIDYHDLCMSVLREVSQRGGARLVVDDLGAGYSNLVRIADLNPAVVKLDREMIREVDKKPRRLELAKRVNELCAALGAQVVAEGIETEAELAAIRDIGITYGQGYFLARPANPVPTVHWPF